MSSTTAPDRAHLILGCGYTGMVMARALRAAGASVVATARSRTREAVLCSMGAHFVPLDLTPAPVLPVGDFATITLLAPPPDDLDEVVDRVVSIGEQIKNAILVVVVSTALYGTTTGVVTEHTRPCPRTPRARRWQLQELAALSLRYQKRLPVRVVRTPAIYGPGRDFQAQLADGSARVIRPAPPTSRIHVEDLAALLIRMGQTSAPPYVLACDELPCPTWQVMQEAAMIYGLPPPEEVSPARARQVFSPLGVEMRLSGRACMSIVRPWLDLPLRYPTYRQGLASQEAPTAHPHAASR